MEALQTNPKKGLSRLSHKFVTLPLSRLLEKLIMSKRKDHIYKTFGGHIFFQTLRTAVQLDLFTLLDNEGALTRQQIAQKLKIEEQPCRIILLGLVSSGLLNKRGERYSNTYVSKLLFNRNSPKKITAYVELQHRAMYKGLYWLLDSVKENRNVGIKEIPGSEPTLYQRLAHDPELEKIFQEAMEELSVHANVDLAKYVDMSGVKHLVDVGGGNGTNVIEFARQWPHLRASVFDSPTVCDMAKENIAAHGLQNRLGVIPGDCFNTPFPKGADAFMFAHFFTIWGEKKDRELLRKCFEALPSGGRVIIFNMMQNDDETGPLSAAVGSPYFLSLATGLGMLYTAKEYEQWMRAEGFTTIHKTKLLRDHGVIIGIKP